MDNLLQSTFCAVASARQGFAMHSSLWREGGKSRKLKSAQAIPIPKTEELSKYIRRMLGSGPTSKPEA